MFLSRFFYLSLLLSVALFFASEGFALPVSPGESVGAATTGKGIDYPVASTNCVWIKSFLEPKTPPEDKWLAWDKALHLGVSALLSSTSYYVYRYQFHNTPEGTLYFSAGFTLTLGVAKECYDAKHPNRHNASWKDLVTDVVGMGLGIGLVFTLD